MLEIKGMQLIRTTIKRGGGTPGIMHHEEWLNLKKPGLWLVVASSLPMSLVEIDNYFLRLKDAQICTSQHDLFLF